MLTTSKGRTRERRKRNNTRHDNSPTKKPNTTKTTQHPVHIIAAVARQRRAGSFPSFSKPQWAWQAGFPRIACVARQSKSAIYTQDQSHRTKTQAGPLAQTGDIPPEARLFLSSVAIIVNRRDRTTPHTKVKQGIKVASLGIWTPYRPPARQPQITLAAKKNSLPAAYASRSPAPAAAAFFFRAVAASASR